MSDKFSGRGRLGEEERGRERESAAQSNTRLRHLLSILAHRFASLLGVSSPCMKSSSRQK